MTNVDDQNAGYDRHLAALNAELAILTNIFPDVLSEVFREMLVRFDSESRLEAVVNHLLKNEELWVKGRWRTPVDRTKNSDPIDVTQIPEADCFRRNSYMWAVKAALLQEFKTLSKSTVNAVLAEQNHSYSLARPVLQNIATKGWRHSIGKFLSRWSRKSDNNTEKHAFIRWTKTTDGSWLPSLKATGDPELDDELHKTVLAPLYAQHKAQQEANDWEIAVQTNQEEAESADALFECGCCFSSTTFERITTCTASTHIICFDCLSSAVNEALFGQGWDRSVHHDRGLLRCMALTANDNCEGCIPQDATRHAIYQRKKGDQIFSVLESRLAQEALVRAQVPLVRCSVCSYAEATDLYLPPGSFQYGFNTRRPFRTLFYVLLSPCFLLFTISCMLLSHVTHNSVRLPSLRILFQTALTRLANIEQFPTQFQCRSPSCSTLSCTTCSKPWRDPHTCFESEALELRITVEAARTAALKRTCPSCGLGFIKDSGCNKLTCICGYVMCYVCRQGLGPGEGGEGYQHFCQHFRYPTGRCRQCEKCDLYRAEDEDALVKAAGVEAEREWREKQGLEGGGGKLGKRNAVSKKEKGKGKWTVQAVVDWWVQGVLTCTLRPARPVTDR
ncbi:MAG: hypothetical protein L6R40_000130 [Gallowayella cf. fulva]|nr:MAG: hypothetical protein L6R40_000130 [Xanthomendoza cf. fulva]